MSAHTTGDDGYWAERRFRAMGSDAHVQVGDAPAALADWAVDEIERLEQCWSRFRPDSELCRLNAAGGATVTVSTPLLDALVTARRLHDATEGRFDPTVLEALEVAGYDRTFAEVVAASAAAPDRPARPAPGFDHVEIDEAAGTVRLPPGSRVDLGGLGKGLAADRVAEGLVDRGARSALVSLGGDIRVAGEPPAGGWRIPVEDPLDPDAPHRLVVVDEGALVTSTTRIRRWSRHGEERHHLIDPATGRSTATGIAAVVAAHASAAWAEGVAKAAVVAGPDGVPALSRRTGVHLVVIPDPPTPPVL